MSYDPYQSPQPAGQSPQPAGQAPQQLNSNLALFSLLLGISSLLMAFPTFCCCAVVFVQVPAALTAIGLGVVALQKINQGRATGKGMAITGITCAGVALFLTVAFFAMVAITGMDNPGGNPFDRGVDIQINDLDEVDFGIE